ncbi:hypothetical protein D5S17_05300 [Pseudonocardiaceae bacterium YIM PH 21723]|nr:hypothetical protein D5S17_05300 [Pseudonocardiaceae bacterium YIM PH 21723]
MLTRPRSVLIAFLALLADQALTLGLTLASDVPVGRVILAVLVCGLLSWLAWLMYRGNRVLRLVFTVWAVLAVVTLLVSRTGLLTAAASAALNVTFLIASRRPAAQEYFRRRSDPSIGSGGNTHVTQST